MRSDPSWLRPPVIVAEALLPVHDPLAGALDPGPRVPGLALVQAIAHALAPAEAGDTPPAWLFASQHHSFRRSLAAIRRYGGALLADPVGSGKTYIALAVAATCEPGTIVAIVPAALRSQWRMAGERTGARLHILTHEAVSRGRKPPDAAFVILDESHHFRNPATRRYAELAPWLIGRRGMLLSATPVVNHLADLGHQLMLFVRENALAPAIPSLRLVDALSHHALAELVIAGRAESGRPSIASHHLEADPRDTLRSVSFLSGIDALALSRAKPIRELIRTTLWSALASSPAALRASLAAYRGLLLHARDALASGRRLDRRLIRNTLGDRLEQLFLWELLASDGGGVGELVLEDLPALERLIGEADRWMLEGDAKSQRLGPLLAHGPPTLVFTSSTATVHWLRSRLQLPRLAWCTGSGAGIGSTRLPRESVLSWFRPDSRQAGSGEPRVLLATDVAAEGLDLQRAGRVVHYDLPWTPMRLEQRAGRARRLGSRFARIDAVRFEPPPPVEERLRRCAILAVKRALPSLVGLDPIVDAPWAWRFGVASRWGEGPGAHGVAEIRSARRALLVAFRVHGVTDRPPLHIWCLADGRWSDDPKTIERRLEEAVSAEPALRHSVSTRYLLRAAAGPIRRALAGVSGVCWPSDRLDEASRAVLRTLHQLGREAVSERDSHLLATIDRAIAFLRRGHTAGERALIAEARGLEPARLRRWLERLPAPDEVRHPPGVELVGLLWFGE